MFATSTILRIHSFLNYLLFSFYCFALLGKFLECLCCCFWFILPFSYCVLPTKPWVTTHILLSSQDFPELLALLEILTWILKTWILKKSSQRGFIKMLLYHKPPSLSLPVFSLLVNSTISPYF